MPCNCDYLNPREDEKDSLAILGFLQELGQKVGEYHAVYGRTPTMNKDIEKLCSLCQKLNVSKFSLELQIWWRDHQRADKDRIKKEIFDIKRLKERKLALEKLTEYERKLLNL